MISQVSNFGVNYLITALNRGSRTSGTTRLTTPTTSTANTSTTTRSLSDTVSIHKLEPSSLARLYLPNGLMAGETAPGGTGQASRIQADGKDLASSGKPIFVAKELPKISRASKSLLERTNESAKEKDSFLDKINESTEKKDNLLEEIKGYSDENVSARQTETGKGESLLNNDSDIKEFEQRVSTVVFGGHQNRSIKAYREQDEQYSPQREMNSRQTAASSGAQAPE
ncbi:MAG: hypothetical protein GY847_38115 [Proteobacteria bacterium]|nr:hypothetical protein [Pseudomonadota bacterium]